MGVISAQELLASNPISPYIGGPPDTIPPTLKLSSAVNPSATRLSVSAIANDNQGIARVVWYLDQSSEPGQQGTQWTLDANALARGAHRTCRLCDR